MNGDHLPGNEQQSYCNIGLVDPDHLLLPSPKLKNTKPSVVLLAILQRSGDIANQESKALECAAYGFAWLLAIIQQSSYPLGENSKIN